MPQKIFEILPKDNKKFNPAGIWLREFKPPAHYNSFKLHWHNTMELLRIKKGKLYVEYGKDFKCVTLLPGDLIILPPHVIHKGYTLDEPVEYAMLMFDIKDFYNKTPICSSLLPSIFDNRAIFKTVTSDPDTIRHFDEVFENCNNPSLETISKIYQLFFQLFEKNLLEIRSEARDDSIKEIIKYIEDNFDKNLDIQSMCQMLNYSPAYFCRKFKQNTGLTPMAFLKIYRLECARKMIKKKYGSIKEIALLCGFTDQNYFTRCFKEHFGVPPTQYEDD